LSLPPFRAEQVGSFLRPAELREAREQARNGRITDEQLREVQDRSIRALVAKQEAIGMPVVTDGEVRRDFWNVDFFARFDGVEAAAGTGLTAFSGSQQPLVPKVTGKIRRTRPLVADDFRFLKSVAKAVPKATFPAPAVIYHRRGRADVSTEAYPDLAEMWDDLVTGYRAEIRDLADAGCRYIQIDDTSFAYLCDASLRQAFLERGEEPRQLLMTYARALNESIAERPPGMAIGLHTCRGNFMSTWAAQGGYEWVADVLFNQVNVDGYFLEFDSDRAGGFEPLRFLPKGKKIVLGLVTTKKPQLESVDDIRRRIDEAAQFTGLDALCLSPQCGFSSSHHGNALTEDDQWRKLELVLEISRKVWG
jgi:5-methyltetrahydropteroyltriglutamate--homocysteine methyltransferase